MRRPGPESRSRARSGMVLLVVVGLAATLATLAVALVLRMRSDARESYAVLWHAQSRVMLSAALAYLQESSRLGWDGAGGVGVDATGETFGWTDARDGALGPRGARPAAPSVTVDGTGLDPDPAHTVPTWWTALYGPSGSLGVVRTYKPYFSSADEADPALFPAPAVRRWPLPGSVARCDMPVWETPPYAIKPIFSANPVRPPVPYGDPSWVATWKATPGMNRTWLPDIFDARQGALGMLDPQPVKDTWGDFVAGTPNLRSGSRGQAWFRIYRELLSDHDNNPADDVDYGILGGDAAAIAARSFDHVALYDPGDVTSTPPLRNYSVFIIACGSGGSHGYRFWSLLGNDPRRALEPVTAAESGLFPSEAVFDVVRQGEVVRWFRVEHSARVIPGLGDRFRRTAYVGNDSSVAGDYNFPWLNGSDSGRDRAALSGSGDSLGNSAGGFATVPGALAFMQGFDPDGGGDTPHVPVSRGGSFTWIERLDREPIKW